MVLTRVLFIAIVALAMALAPQFGRWPGIAGDAAVAAAQGLGASATSPEFHVVAMDDDDDDDDGDDDDSENDNIYSEEPVRTGGGQDPEDFGLSDGVVNPGAEDLGIDDEDDDD